MDKKLTNYAIILASGTGKRFRGDIPKQFAKFGNKTILEHTVECFENNDDIDFIVIATNPEYIEKVKELVKNNGYKKVYKVVEGGTTRKESSYNAVNSIDEADGNVLIHDGARPFVSQKIITDCIKALDKYYAVTTAIPMTDTVIEVENKIINNIPDRSNLMRVQTPQGFKLSLIKKAHELAKGESGFTDDCGMILRYNLADIHIIEGDPNNIKITYPEDIPG